LITIINIHSVLSMAGLQIRESGPGLLHFYKMVDNFVVDLSYPRSIFLLLLIVLHI